MAIDTTIALHPAMTAAQIADWCHTHGKVVHIEWAAHPDGIRPVIVALDDTPSDSIPMFLRRQAD